MISKFSNIFGRELKTKNNFNINNTFKYTNMIISKIKININKKNIIFNSKPNKNPYKISLQKFSKLIEKEKINEENKELNSTRRNNLRREKEIDLLNKIESKKYIEEVYTKEEFENLFLDKKNNEIILYRMTSIYKIDTIEKMKYLNYALPVCFFGGFVIDFIFPVVKKGFLIKFFYYNCLFFDYGLFIYFVYKLFHFKTRTISAKYNHNDKIIELSYLNFFGKEKFIKENLFDLKRITTNDQILSKIISKKNNNEFSFYRNLQEINYRKLFNYIFPKAEVKKRKEPSMVDTLWEKN